MKKLLKLGVLAVMAIGAYLAFNSAVDEKNRLASQDVEALSACEITSGEKVVFSCSGGGQCSGKKLGYQLTCDGTQN